MGTCGELINSVDKDRMFLNQIITGNETSCFLHNLKLKQQLSTWKLPSPSREEKPWQDKSKGMVMFQVFFFFCLIWNCSHGIHPRTSSFKQAQLQGNPLLSIQLNSSQVSQILLQEKMPVATRQQPCTTLCAGPRGAGKTIGHHFITPSTLI
jgi:hypothetical protein